MFLLWYLRVVRSTAHDIPFVHLGIALIGNLAFVVGSLFFLSPTLTRAGTWLFVVASWGLLVGVIGEIASRYEARVRASAADGAGNAGKAVGAVEVEVEGMGDPAGPADDRGVPGRSDARH